MEQVIQEIASRFLKNRLTMPNPSSLVSEMDARDLKTGQ